MTYTLFFNPDSANLVVRMALEELGVAYDDEEVPRRRSDRSAAFFAMNPRGLLPVLTDHDTGAPVFETAAILLYLADKHGRLAPSPSNLKQRGACLRWLFMLSNTLHADLRASFYADRFALTAEEAPRARAASRRRVLGHIALLNSAIEEAGGDWFLPSGLSVCDFYLGCCLRWAQCYPSEDPPIRGAEIEAHPTLFALLTRLGELASVRAALAKEGIEGPAFIEPISPLLPRKPDGAGAVP